MKQNDLDLNQLRAFLEVADRSSFRRAAEELCLSAPALSRRVELLEERLGARLLERTSRSVRLTEIGASFRDRAQAALDDLDAAAFQVARNAAGSSERITVSCIPSVALGVIPDALHAAEESLPGIKVRVIDDSATIAIAKVRDGEADFGVAFLPEPIAELVFDPVVEDPFVLVVVRSHNLARRRSVRLASLGNENWIALGRTSGNRQLVNRALADLGIYLPYTHEAAHIASLLALVEAGLGIALLPRLAMPTRNTNIRVLKLSDFALARTIGIVSNPAKRLSPQAAAFRTSVELSLRRALKTVQGK
ncbi:LysR family transcriptional regulator [Cupriavidus sp. 2SB]|uniref:LysR family transcriptional regulator n=1 Tax=Cupriavidus sp. 2SB TaxID=2502199 RepID=UPI001485733C|nr:LysR family transcriptional regulator [Cupriavidus sp. 2SB]